MRNALLTIRALIATADELQVDGARAVLSAFVPHRKVKKALFDERIELFPRISRTNLARCFLNCSSNITYS